ncbi:STAS domain-containing protein [Streptomyces sp. NPDC004542]|uniref:STAS domain-containing protein n=1 Tax=Streptomyces sp. NPDC004542 TaxID=3154281 RepID=UPI0033B1FF07
MPEPARPAPQGSVAPKVQVPQLRVRPLSGRAGVQATGEVSWATRGVWEHTLEQAVREDEEVYCFELSEVTFVDVAGVDALAGAAQRLRDGCRLVVDRPPPTLPRLLELFWPGLRTIEVSNT